MKKPDPAKLRSIKLTTRDRGELASALPECYRALRLVGYRRRTVIVAFLQAWWRGDIRVDPDWKPPADPQVRILYGRRPGETDADVWRSRAWERRQKGRQ